MKMHSKKGFVLTLDVTFALILTVMALTSFVFYSHAKQPVLYNMQLQKTGSDVLALLDYNSILDGLDNSTIYTEMNNLLPLNNDMRIEINCDSSGNVNIGSEPSQDIISSSKRYFVITSGGEIVDYCTAQSWVWHK